jgi:hypothetical protein
VATRAVQHLQLEYARDADLAGLEHRQQTGSYARVTQAREGAFVDEVCRRDQRQASDMRSRLSSSRPSIVCRRCPNRRRASRATISSSARWTVAFKPRVPRIAPARASKSSSTSSVVLCTPGVYRMATTLDIRIACKSIPKCRPQCRPHGVVLLKGRLRAGRGTAGDRLQWFMLFVCLRYRGTAARCRSYQQGRLGL